MLETKQVPIVKEGASVRSVQDQVNQVQETMRENISISMQNLESAANLAERTEQLSSNASVFRRSARRVRNKMWWMNLKYGLCCCLVIFIVAGGTALFTIPQNNAVESAPSPPPLVV